MAQHTGQTQTTTQKQQLKALQVQIAMAELVGLPITELSTYIDNEMQKNEALEKKDEEGDEYEDVAINNDSSDDNEDNDFDNNSDEDEKSLDAPNSFEDDPTYGTEADGMGDYFSVDDVPDNLRQRADAQQNSLEPQSAASISFYEELKSQMSEHDLNDDERDLMEYLIGSLDEDGFLRKDLETISDELLLNLNMDASVQELEHLLGILQQFEPRGIGARSLQECLHIQLTDPEHKTPYTHWALTVIDRYFNDFIKNHRDIIKQRLKVDNETFEHIYHELTHLNPKPGRALGESADAGAPTIIPDFYISITTEGDIDIALNQDETPELRVSQSYRDTINLYGNHKDKLTREQKDAYTYAREKVDSANAFINMLTRRKQTLLAVMRAIVCKQRPFFLDDDNEDLLQPLTLKEVADLAKVDVSTVSRVTNNKYVHTDYRTYPLKFFFSSQFTTSEGEELSARKVKKVLRELIENEDKKHPLSDEALAAELKKQGYDVARRTVAKYRDMLQLPTARLRKHS